MRNGAAKAAKKVAVRLLKKTKPAASVAKLPGMLSLRCAVSLPGNTCEKSKLGRLTALCL